MMVHEIGGCKEPDLNFNPCPILGQGFLYCIKHLGATKVFEVYGDSISHNIYPRKPVDAGKHDTKVMFSRAICHWHIAHS